MADQSPSLPPASVPVIDENNALTPPWRRALQQTGSTASAGITQLTGDVTANGPGIATAQLSDTGVTGGSYTSADITVDAKGRITKAANGSSASAGSDALSIVGLAASDGYLTVSAAMKLARTRTFSYTGDIAGGPTAFNGTANVTTTLTLPNIVAGATNTKITYNAKGQVTAGTSAILASADFANQGTTTTVLHGDAAGNPSWAAVIEADQSLSDVTTWNVSTTRHGYVPKLPNDATQFLNGTGAFSVPAGGSGGSWLPLVDGSEPPAFITDGAGVLIAVAYSP